MKMHIEFCIKWNYGPEFDRVSKVVNQINKDIRIQANKNSPRTGAFEVTINDVLVYSKFQTGTFPHKDDINSWF